MDAETTAYYIWYKKEGAMMTGAQSVASVTDHGVLTIYLEGDIDHHIAQSVRARIDTKLFVEKPDKLILDLSEVRFMDSSGLGLILGRYAKATELGIPCILANPNPPIRRILDLAGTERLIKIETRSDAQSNRKEN